MIITTEIYIALGSNLGDRQANLAGAIRRLRRSVAVEQLSSVYETEPAYVADQPPFYNMVLQGTTALSPIGLLRFLKRIEQELGRQHTTRYGPRLIDLDILIYGDEQLERLDLIIPHPRLTERAFVLIPLAEIAPHLIIPGRQKSVADLADRLGSEAPGQVVRVIKN